jgi:hypothetical protein
MALCASDDLADLRNHWGSAYEISIGHEQFIAVRRDGKGVIASSSVRELWRLIREDYNRNPVPRDI